MMSEQQPVYQIINEGFFLRQVLYGCQHIRNTTNSQLTTQLVRRLQFSAQIQEMRLLDIPEIVSINSFLDKVDLGNHLVCGNLEVYSCKPAGSDKKLSKSIELGFYQGNESSSMEFSKSPVGPLSDARSADGSKTLVNLILTLNHVYPDYDFTRLKAEDFQKEDGSTRAQEVIDSFLLEVGKVWEESRYQDSFLDTLWATIDDAIQLKTCDVYSYRTDGGRQLLGDDSSIWFFSFFFYNKGMKRMLYFGCRGLSKGGQEEFGSENEEGEDQCQFDLGI
eukprot:TRINITY_DN6436_c0_g1_i1.p1 TRINITY_DN6436_c0_g1~~TRINITY_DN6436_c0_g1_i1.p1  ORF type:complete len:278 (-),score=21.06 TRINITY_DN6436_c0_g1_i1:229-1062(-)